MTYSNHPQLITDINVMEYFRDSLNAEVSRQKISVSDETMFYVVNMLTMFTRSEQLFEQTKDGYLLKSLALLYAETFEVETVAEKNRLLQRLGDIALFISGLFSYSLNRSLVDVDYYIAMGGNAYSCLADSTRHVYQGKIISEVFTELADKFMALVDVLAELKENTCLSSDSDILRIYELWLKTGSKRLAKKLSKNGITPIVVTEIRQ
jgi:hypothetical protein